MLIENLLFRFIWVIFLAATVANASIWWWRAQPHIRRDPSVREEYVRLVRGFLIWTSIPWLLMGLGILGGWVPSIGHFFAPRTSPFALAWYLYLVAFWIGAGYW